MLLWILNSFSTAEKLSSWQAATHQSASRFPILGSGFSISSDLKDVEKSASDTVNPRLTTSNIVGSCCVRLYVAKSLTGFKLCATTCNRVSKRTQQRQRRHSKSIRCFKLYHAYSISFNSTNVGNFFWSWILKDCIELDEKKKNVVVLCSRPPRNVKMGIFTSYSKWRQRNVQKSVMHVQSCCFANLNQLRFCSSLWRCPSSLLKGEHSVAMLGQCCNYSKQCCNAVLRLKSSLRIVWSNITVDSGSVYMKVGDPK